MQRSGLALMKRKLLLYGLVGLLATVGVVTFIFIKPMITPQPPDSDFLKSIIEEFPDFKEGDKPVIAIDSISRHKYQWYIVTIKSNKEVNDSVPVRLVMYQSGSKLSTVIKPDTRFTEVELKEKNLPESAIVELLQ
jgi:hypothetical protein